MGSAVSISSNENDIVVSVKGLPEAIENSVFVYEKFPVIIDPSNQAGIFLKYQVGPFIDLEDPISSSLTNLNRALVSSLQHGRTMTVVLPSNGINENIFDPNLFPRDVINRNLLYRDDSIWRSVLKKELGDPNPDDVSPSQSFIFIVYAKQGMLPNDVLENMQIIRIEDVKTDKNKDKSDIENEIIDDVADLFGAKEVIRNSTQLVEAAFDGDLDVLKSWMEKGYHPESTDGRQNTALSEAASQGHLNVVSFLLEHGCDPNALGDTGRSPLWRAAFNGYVEMVRLLLEAGADPDVRDKVSMESAFDFAKTVEVRDLLTSWDRTRTLALIACRRAARLASIESRIRTAAERDQHARLMLRQELVGLAESGQLSAMLELLETLSLEVSKEGGRPRATAETSRNSLGQSLLSIAAQRDDEDVVRYLLTHWQTVQEDRVGMVGGDVDVAAQIFRGNPNSRDAKGWTCVCIAVFHDSRRALSLLLQHGGDPNIRSAYNKNAWDLAKDELDAAEKVVRSRAEVRLVLQEHDRANQSIVFGDGSSAMRSGCATTYAGLDKDGSSVVMNIEMNEEAARRSETEASSLPKVVNTGGKNKGKKKHTDSAEGSHSKESKIKKTVTTKAKK